MGKVSFTDQIRREIDRCGVSRYRIAKAAGVAQSGMAKLMAGGSIRWESLDRIAAVIGLSIVRDPKAAAKLAKNAPRPGRPCKETK